MTASPRVPRMARGKTMAIRRHPLRGVGHALHSLGEALLGSVHGARLAQPAVDAGTIPTDRSIELTLAPGDRDLLTAASMSNIWKDSTVHLSHDTNTEARTSRLAGRTTPTGMGTAPTRLETKGYCGSLGRDPRGGESMGAPRPRWWARCAAAADCPRIVPALDCGTADSVGRCPGKGRARVWLYW